MTPRQRQQFIDGLGRNRIEHKEHYGGEISMLCPQCSPMHDKPRQTLSINTNNDRWQCWRCPNLRGRKAQIKNLLDALNLSHLRSVFEEDEVMIEDDSLSKIKGKLLFGERGTSTLPVEVSLPEGYRVDWKKTVMGESLLNYLMSTRKLSPEVIIKYKIGYIVSGKYAGSVVLPVYMANKLCFWQIRRVLMIGNAPKYDSPKIERSAVMFGYDSITTKSVNIVEGIFDALAMGEGTIGLLSKSITEQQIALLGLKGIETARVILDGEAWKECQQVAHTIVKKLWTVKRVTAIRLPFGKDPGKLGLDTMKNSTDALNLKP